MVGAVALNFASVRTDHVLQTVQGPVIGMWGGRESDGTILNLATPGSAYILPMRGLIARLTARTEFVWKCTTRAINPFMRGECMCRHALDARLGLEFARLLSR
jgi:hypothetical protein